MRGMDPATALFDELAPTYEEHFAVPTRRAYDDLAWELTRPLVRPGARVIDVGCGIGRWAERFLAGGHTVIGLEPSAAMAAAARGRLGGQAGFQLAADSVETAVRPDGCADLVVAMGSLQYAHDPSRALARMAGWLAPGGRVSVLVDGLVALCVELGRSGHLDEATQRATTRRGVWEQNDRRAELHLFDRDALVIAAAGAGLVDIRVRGLLVGFSLLGRDALSSELERDYRAQLARERAWAEIPALADLGKQLLLTARRPGDGQA